MKAWKQLLPRSLSRRNNTPSAYDFNSGLTVLQEKQIYTISMFYQINSAHEPTNLFQAFFLQNSALMYLYPQTYRISIITEGVWAMAPTRLQAQITHRKMRKASWHPAVGHFPGTAVANSLSLDTQEQPVRFCEQKRMRSKEPFKQ